MNRTSLLLTFFALLIVCAGCQTRLDAPFIDEGTFVSIQPRMAADLISWQPNVPQSQRTVPVHADDGGPGVGGVLLDLDGGSTGQRLGVNLAAGTESIRFLIGVDCRFNNVTDEPDDEDDDDDWEYGEGPMRDIERQPLPGNFSSYGYAWIEPSDYNWIPYLGMETEIADRLVLGLEAGAPYGKFTYERGHYRNFIATAIEHDSWRGFGRRAAGSVGLRVLDNRGMVGLQYAFERYDTSFANVSSEIDAHVFSIFFSLRF